MIENSRNFHTVHDEVLEFLRETHLLPIFFVKLSPLPWLFVLRTGKVGDFWFHEIFRYKIFSRNSFLTITFWVAYIDDLFVKSWDSFALVVLALDENIFTVVLLAHDEKVFVVLVVLGGTSVHTWFFSLLTFFFFSSNRVTI